VSTSPHSSKSRFNRASVPSTTSSPALRRSIVRWLWILSAISTRATASADDVPHTRCCAMRTPTARFSSPTATSASHPDDDKSATGTPSSSRPRNADVDNCAVPKTQP
jgi:hypothetical protein